MPPNAFISAGPVTNPLFKKQSFLIQIRVNSDRHEGKVGFHSNPEEMRPASA